METTIKFEGVKESKETFFDMLDLIDFRDDLSYK